MGCFPLGKVGSENVTAPPQPFHVALGQATPSQATTPTRPRPGFFTSARFAPLGEPTTRKRK